MMALNQPEAGWRESDGEKSDLADVVVNLLKEHAVMLDDYFSMVPRLRIFAIKNS
jgi:hypothetical protein